MLVIFWTRFVIVPFSTNATVGRKSILYHRISGRSTASSRMQRSYCEKSSFLISASVNFHTPAQGSREDHDQLFPAVVVFEFSCVVASDLSTSVGFRLKKNTTTPTAQRTPIMIRIFIDTLPFPCHSRESGNPAVAQPSSVAFVGAVRELPTCHTPIDLFTRISTRVFLSASTVSRFPGPLQLLPDRDYQDRYG